MMMMMYAGQYIYYCFLKTQTVALLALPLPGNKILNTDNQIKNEDLEPEENDLTAKRDACDELEVAAVN